MATSMQICSGGCVGRVTLTIVVMALIAGRAEGQRSGRGASGGCPRPDTTAAWFASQRQSLDDSKHDWSDDALRGALLQAAGLGEAQALRPVEGWQFVDRAPSPLPGADSMLARLRSLTRGRGSIWPTREFVGAAGVRAVGVLVQRDTALERPALHRMMEAGLGASIPADVAIMEDRVRLLSGRKQLYGTQLRGATAGPAQPLAIEDSAHVDLRRDAAGLPPLRNAVCAASGAQ